jgi:hypothetical protein
METKVNRSNITRHLLEKELEMAGKTILDTLDEEYWFNKFTLTREQYLEFRKYSIRLIKKVFRCNGQKAFNTFGWFYLTLGLRIKG